MLSSLTIKNYALIDELSIDFKTGLTTITGETGAGKSILLGGFSLVLGKRADLGSLKHKEEKCIIEAEFFIKNYDLALFFDKSGLDYYDYTVLRREILPSGKSRAFINDTPVTLDIMNSLGERLIDIHSQFDTQKLTEKLFQLKLIDAIADNAEIRASYRDLLKQYKQLSVELNELISFKKKAQETYDYNKYLWEELSRLELVEGMQEKLEEESKKLEHIEQIKEALLFSSQSFSNEQIGIIHQLTEVGHAFGKVLHISNSYKTLRDRIDSVTIELRDIENELSEISQTLEVNPDRLETVNQTLQTLYDVQRKHQSNSISDLIIIRDNLEEKLTKTNNISSEIDLKTKALNQLSDQLNQLAKELHKSRQDIVPNLEYRLIGMLKDLGMPNVQFKIKIELLSDFDEYGKDNIVFLFSANKGMQFSPLKKVASGGERSRIMLVLKCILSEYESLPTIIFDEIDTGVSGEVSKKMAEIMHQLSDSMQVITITHLPQIAARGHQHFKVYKHDQDNLTVTKIKELNAENRVYEIAEMLGGKELSDSALKHAQELLIHN